MGELINTILDDWSMGVVNSIADEHLPENASPRGWNSCFLGTGQGKTPIGKRKGCLTVNATPVTGSPAIIGQYGFKKWISPYDVDMYHLLVSDNGRLDVIDDSTGVVTAADAGTTTPFTTGTLYPDFAAANNLCFIVNGTDAKKFDGSDVWNFGIVRPTVGTLSGAAGAGGTANGTYELRVSYYNANTGHESSISNTSIATVTVASKKIDVSNIPVSSDTQVTARRLYIRNTSTMSDFYLAGTVGDNTSTTHTIDFIDANLITVAPTTSSNDCPPAGAKVICWHGSRMFAATTGLLYYSEIDKPEAFDAANYLSINADDGQTIVGLLSAFESLIIFKTNSVYGLFGTAPSNWEVRQIVPNIGCSSHRTICMANGIAYWLSEFGPVRMATVGQVESIGALWLGNTFKPTAVNIDAFTKGCAAVDVINYRVMFAIPDILQTRNTIIIPFNYRLDKFESDRWDPMDISSIASIGEPSVKPEVYLGGYKGQMFKWWSGTNDGVPSGTNSGTITSITSTSVINDSTASFLNTGGKLIERSIYLISPADVATRRRITTNTGTQITLDSAVSDITTSWTYIIGGIDFQWDTAWLHLGPRFVKKRMKFLYGTVVAGANVVFEALLNFGSTVQNTTIEAATTLGSGTWGYFSWSDNWGSSQIYTSFRHRIGKNAQAVKLRVRNRQFDKDLGVYALGASAEIKSDKVT